VKRKLFIIIGTVLVLLLSTVSFALAQETVDSSVTESEAEKAALNQIERASQRIDAWSGAILGKPVIYYAPDNTKSAYEFTVLNGDKEVGYILISARKDWMPVLEYSNGSAPSNLLHHIEEYAIERGYVNKIEAAESRLIYWGALSYSVQIGEKMEKENTVIHLPTALIMPMPKMAELQMDKDDAKAAWSKLLTETVSKPQTKSVEWEELSGVPLWYQHNNSENATCQSNGWCCDRYSENADAYPDCAGEAEDPWNPWDGCSAIAGAMVVGYDQYGISEDDETLIDDCHDAMDTSDEGETDPWDFDNGIEYVFDLYSVTSDASNDYLVSWNDIKGEIDAERPFMLSFSGHSQTGVGYEWDTSDPYHRKVWVHTTWDDPRTAVIDFGNWSAACMTKVEVD
jgi:hypothetical protein